jgi:hypothetical protein
MRLTVSLVRLGVEPRLGLMTRYYSLTATVLSLWGAPSDEGTGLSFVRVIVSNNVSCQYVQYIQFICPYI